MTFGRAVASVTASLTVAGCAVVALGMSHTGSASHQAGAHAARSADASPTARPAHLPPAAASATPAARIVSHPAGAGRSDAAPLVPTSRSVPPTAAVATASGALGPTPATRAVTRPTATRAPTTPPTQAARPTASHAAPATPATTKAATTKARTTHTPTAPTRAATEGHSLPLGFTTGNARKVITVVAHSHHSTTATLQAWSKVSGGWAKYGSAVTATVGSDGLSKHASESKSATPIGSFTMTRAFGHDSDPGTSLPYVHTTPADWWISQPGKLYNTLQACSSHCAFNQGNPNEHLYYETPFYDYAVVIDYNTRNAPGGVRQGAGSAFFLHVHPAGTGPTAGCVSIPMSTLVKIMRWLTPQSHARILIGV